MPVFKLCLKIIKKNIPSMLIYITIFLGISFLIASSNTKNQNTGFNTTKSNVAFISEESSPFIDGFRAYLSKTANFVDIEDSTEKLQDALYFRSVTYIIRIPEGFTSRFLNGEDVQIEKTVIPNSISNAYVDLSIDQYFNTAKLYVKSIKGISQDTLVENLKDNLDIDTPVKTAKTAPVGDTSFTAYYFNYLSYSLFSVLILGISAIMLVFNNTDLKRKNLCSPISAGRINFQFILANSFFTLVCWVIMVGFCFLFNTKNMFYKNTLYFLLNSFVFTMCASSISFLIGSLIKNRNAVSAVCNVVTLGPCFMSGVFVPQEMLGDFVLKVASFTPTYWYVKANNEIANLTSFDYAQLSTTFSYILIEAGFALAFFAMSLVIGKRKRISN